MLPWSAIQSDDSDSMFCHLNPRARLPWACSSVLPLAIDRTTISLSQTLPPPPYSTQPLVWYSGGHAAHDAGDFYWDVADGMAELQAIESARAMPHPSAADPAGCFTTRTRITPHSSPRRRRAGRRASEPGTLTISDRQGRYLYLDASNPA